MSTNGGYGECPKCGYPEAYYEVDTRTGGQETICNECGYTCYGIWELQHDRVHVGDLVNATWKRTEYLTPKVRQGWKWEGETQKQAQAHERAAQAIEEEEEEEEK